MCVDVVENKRAKTGQHLILYARDLHCTDGGTGGSGQVNLDSTRSCQAEGTFAITQSSGSDPTTVSEEQSAVPIDENVTSTELSLVLVTFTTDSFLQVKIQAIQNIYSWQTKLS